ncbi:MAG: ABC transporter ATP-binding protein, partial [Clostridia bacterium]
LALLGENGSGKTTLMNMLSGIYKPDSGSIFVNGKKVVINTPEDSKRLGIGMVHQHFKLVDVFSAADNIWMGAKTPKYNLKAELAKLYAEPRFKDENRSLFYFRQFGKKLLEVLKCAWHYFSNLFLTKNRYKKIAETAKKFGFAIDPKKKVYDMAVSEKQTIEIIKVLYYGANVIVLDEPTAVLTVQEIRKLFDVLRKMKAEGHSIIIITHKLNEVMEISDRVTILRKGEYIDTVNTAETSIQQLTDLMVGKKVNLNILRPKIEHDKPLLEIRNLKIKNDEGALAIDDMNFYIRGGEILGVAGISGCGQKELCEAIAGLRKIQGGEINHKGESIIGLSPKKIIEKGIAMSFIPEDRLGMGLAPSLSITDNMLLKSYKGKWYNPFVDRKTARKQAKAIIDELHIVTPSTETPVRRLSGGNVQKVLVGREIQSGPNVIVTAYPVRGLDIKSSYAIYDILNKEKTKGTGIMFVGEDLDVMLDLCDKIMVLCHGKLMGVVHADKTSKEELGLMMTGSLNLTEVKADKHLGIAQDSNIKHMEGENE